MSEKQLITAITDLQTAVYSLKESIDKLHTIEMDKFKTDNSFDMMQTLNGSLQELIKELEGRPIR
jgi:hypothetical protein